MTQHTLVLPGVSASILEGLNPDQRAAVTAPGSALVLAGAGSGKTRVLTTRIAWLIQTGQAPPTGLLAVTFTNKAAKEMQARVSAMLALRTRGLWIGTFHGLCHRMLRAHHREAGLPESFQILDAADQLSAIKRLLKTLNVDTERFEPRRVQGFINQHKEEGLRADRVEAWDPYSRRLVELYAEYDAQCNRDGVADFAELLLRTCELLQRNALLREHYQERFLHILVDEFQDTSRLQYAWLKLLAGPNTHLFAVGDDDQSIYAFRGANVGNMADFMRDLGIGEPIRLTRNYRSQSMILEAANAVIRHNVNRLGKDLWTDAGQGEPLRHFEAADDGEEARFIVETLQALHQDGLPYRQMAVLYRSNAQSRAIEHALFSAGLPYRVYGGQRFFERAEIKHALAYLRLLANPEDDHAFLRVVNFPTRGIGARSLEAIEAEARAAGASLWAVACAKGGRKFAPFIELIETLRGECAPLSLAETVALTVERSGLAEHYRKERGGEERLDNLDELANAARVFVQEAEDASLAGFLAHAALEAGEHEASLHEDAVQLMTVHAAKGLEFDTVFLTGLEEGLFPHEQAAAEPEGLEEERRLMYVALTRARRRLYLSHSQYRILHGQPRYGLPSRFLDEIPAALIQSLRPWRSSPPQNAAAPPAPAAAASPPPHRIGARVCHPRYGEGTVTAYKGQGTETEIGIIFPALGEKWFLLEYARLTPAENAAALDGLSPIQDKRG